MRTHAVLVGVWIGLCAAAIGWTAWGVWFLHTHPSTDYCYGAWINVALFGPVILLALRFWKWVLTICLVYFGGHELHKLFKHMDGGEAALGGALIGWHLNQPQNQRRIGNYWAWLVAKPQGPGALSNDARLQLRLGAVAGLVIYSLTALSDFRWVYDYQAETRRGEQQMAMPSLPISTPTPMPVLKVMPVSTPVPYQWAREQRELEDAATPLPTKHRYVKNGKPAYKQFLALTDHAILVQTLHGKEYYWNNEFEMWRPLAERE